MRQRRTLAILGFAAFTLGPGRLGAVSPPADSPLARREHPRLFITAADLPALKARITGVYKGTFQQFVNELDGAMGSGPASSERARKWGGMNYAFLSLLDPRSMPGFSASHSAAEYARKAIEYAKALLPTVASGESESHSMLTTVSDSGGMLYLSAFTVYDWCFPHLSDAERQAFADAAISACNANAAYRSNPPDLDKMVLNNQVSGDSHDILPVLAFYNDPIAGSNGAKTYAQWQADMFNSFHYVWIDEYIGRLNYFYGDAAGWYEGPNYGREGFMNGALATAAFSSAMGVNFFANTPYFLTYPLFLEANTWPRPAADGEYYMNRWSIMSGAKASLESTSACREARFIAGVLRTLGNELASLAKWHYDQPGRCTEPVEEAGGLWANGLIYHFLYGDRDVVAKSPSQLRIAPSQRLGQGEVVMRTGYESTSDSMIAFWATDYWMQPGGHSHRHWGHFTLEKFGHLILKAGNAKSGDAQIETDRTNFFHNVVGVYRGDPDMDFDPTLVDDGPSNLVGEIRALDINNSTYDFVSYDCSRAWGQKASLHHREFVYLRGPLNSEYIVVFDRMRTQTASDPKVWHIWVPSQPSFVDGSPALVTAGKWSSANTTTMMVTNNYSATGSHGRFFLKTLLPAAARTNVVGGPGHEYTDYAGNNPYGTPTMTDAMHDYLGWGRIEVVPAAASNYDSFLNVIQFGDANSLATAAPVILLGGGEMVGVEIRDPHQSRVVMFSGRQDGAAASATLSYTFKSSTPTSRHLLLNLPASRELHVATASAGALGSTVSVSAAALPGGTRLLSNSQGALQFGLEGLQVFDATPPAAPRNLRFDVR